MTTPKVKITKEAACPKCRTTIFQFIEIYPYIKALKCTCCSMLLPLTIDTINECMQDKDEDAS